MSWLRAETEGPLGLEQAIADHRERLEPVHPFLACMDLRWWQARVLAPGSRVEMLTTAEFARRWTWGEKRARLLLKRDAEWGDPYVAEEWKAYRGRTEDGSRTEVGRTEDGIDKGQTPTSSEPGRTKDGSGTDGGPRKGDTRVVSHDHDHDHDHEEQLHSESRTEVDPTPKWARGHKGTPTIAVLGAVVRALEAIRQRPVDWERCASDAKHVLSLWKTIGGPIDELATQIELVARWARDSRDHLAENDVRGMRIDGTVWGTDRSRSVSTLCVHAKWGDRLDAAMRWEAGTDPPRLGRGDHLGNGVSPDQARQIYLDHGVDPENPSF